MGSDLISLFPQNDTPFDSEAKEGFWHITGFNGGADACDINLIIRDFKEKGVEDRIERIRLAIEEVLKKYPTAKISYSVKDQYENMKQYVDKKPIAVKRAKDALIKNGIEPKNGFIRGGTDGATFSKNGLITPNLGTGSYNHHGRYEYLDINEFEKLIQIAIDIVKIRPDFFEWFCQLPAGIQHLV